MTSEASGSAKTVWQSDIRRGSGGEGSGGGREMGVEMGGLELFGEKYT